MRALFLLLLLGNLGFYVYATQLRASADDSARFERLQMSADKMRIAKPEQLAASAPRVPDLRLTNPGATPACLEWGPFDAGDRKLVEPQLAALQLGNRLATRESGNGSFWVYIPPLKSKDEADRKAAELKGLGVNDFFVIGAEGPWQWALSLGVFRSDEAARTQLARLREKGVRSAQSGPRGGDTVFVINDPSDAVTAQVTMLQKEYPLTEVKAVACGGQR